MARAGAEGTPVFLIGGKPEVLAQTEEKLRRQWNVNIVGSQDGYFKPEDRQALFARVRDSGAKLSPWRWVPRARNPDARLSAGQPGCPVYGRRRHLRRLYRPR